LLVNGTCTEDVVVNRFSGVTIQGNPTATLRPVHATDTPVTANTRLILEDVSIADGSTGVAVGPHAYVTVNISGNVAGIYTSQGATVQFVDFNGVSTVSNNGTKVFACYQGGQIYVDKIAGEITPAPTAAQLGCLHVGGP